MNKKNYPKKEEELIDEIIFYLYRGVEIKTITYHITRHYNISEEEAIEIINEITDELERNRKTNTQLLIPNNFSFIDSNNKSVEKPVKSSRAFVKFLFIIGLIILGFYLLDILSAPKFPALENPKKITYQWKYKDKNYNLSTTLYKSVYDYYAEQSRGITCDNEEKCSKKYLEINKNDKELDILINNLQNLTNKNKIFGDQQAEFILSFVQSIPYDSKKFQSKNLTPRFPYQVLYDKKGLCTDKSYLAVSLFQKLGYGTSIFIYNPPADGIGHMAAGIECSQIYSTYNSGYCIAETTTSGWPIGEIPDLKDYGLAASFSGIPTYQNADLINNFIKPSNAEVILKKDGDEYSGIIQYHRNKEQMNKLEKELKSQKAIIDSKEKELENLASKLNYYRSIGSYWQYNYYVPIYNNLIYETQNLISDYNNKVNQYNNLLNKIKI